MSPGNWRFRLPTSVLWVALILSGTFALMAPTGAVASQSSLYEPTSALLRHSQDETAALAVDGIIGSDDRVRVPSTTTAPGAMTVHLLVHWPDDTYTGCSGFMIGPRTVGTAGHCVYDTDFGWWAVNVLATPGADEAYAPFGAALGISVHSVSGWTLLADSTSDMGAVTLDRDMSDAGWFGMQVLDDITLLSSTLTVTGYPGDKAFATMWQSSGSLVWVDSTRLYFQIDATHGNSGGPIFVKNAANEHYVVGILTGGNSTLNMGVRLTLPVFNRFVSWVNEAATPPTPTPAPTPLPPAASHTITSDPSAISGLPGEVGIALITIGAVEGGGPLHITSSGGVLTVNGLLAPESCGRGVSQCVGAVGSSTNQVTIPDTSNDLSTILITLTGTIQTTKTVTIRASQGAVVWQLAILVTAEGTGAAVPPYTAYGTGLRSGDLVEVFVRGVPCGTAVADELGRWLVYVESFGECEPVSGDPITFTLNGQPTDANETYLPGGAPADLENGVTLVVTPKTEPVGGLTGAVASDGISLLVFGGGTFEQLVAAAVEADASSISLTKDGRLVSYIVGAPAFVNAEFRAAFSGVIPKSTVVLLRKAAS